MLDMLNDKSDNELEQQCDANPERRKAMWSMWNAPSDLDYYGQSGFSEDEREEEQEEELEPLPAHLRYGQSGFSGDEPEEEQEEELEPPVDWPEPPDDGLEPPQEAEQQGEQQ